MLNANIKSSKKVPDVYRICLIIAGYLVTRRCHLNISCETGNDVTISTVSARTHSMVIIERAQSLTWITVDIKHVLESELLST
jgi:hypothetical protein